MKELKEQNKYQDKLMQLPDLNEILVYIKVVQSGSFTKAAKLMGIPISTVSARVASLEKRLGVTLLQRTTRQLHLTPIGQVYYEQCLQGMEGITNAENSIFATQAEPQGALKITAPTFLGATLFPKIIAEMVTKYPKISLEVILQDKTLDLISEGIDLALRAGDLKDSSLIAKKLGTVQFELFASSSYLKKHGNPEHPRELKDHCCLQFSSIGKNEWNFSNGKNRVSVPLANRILVDELTVIKNLALAGSGIALLPSYICREEENRGRLVNVLPEWKSLVRNIHFVYPPQKFPSPKLKAFLEVAVGSIKEQILD